MNEVLEQQLFDELYTLYLSPSSYMFDEFFETYVPEESLVYLCLFKALVPHAGIELPNIKLFLYDTSMNSQERLDLLFDFWFEIDQDYKFSQ